jgi:steroid 5-alpha reductase family enzyme
MRAERRHFWLEQFFIVHLVQNLLLVGLTLPFWAIAFRNVAFGRVDLLLLGLASVGIAIARSADAQLDAFMRANEERRARQERRIPLLDQGIWRIPRHPNYFGLRGDLWGALGRGGHRLQLDRARRGDRHDRASHAGRPGASGGVRGVL